MKTNASPWIASLILARRSWPGHELVVSRQTWTPTASSACCNRLTASESGRT